MVAQGGPTGPRGRTGTIAPMEPRERLLNLVQLLLHTSRPLTFDEISDRMGAYRQEREAAKRQFERDKEALRERGIPIEAVTDPFETEHAYRISKEDYYLPEVSFTEEEVAALFVAAHGDPEATRAFGKLVWGTDQAVLSEVLQSVPTAVDASEEHLLQAGHAVRARRRVRFGYRPSGEDEGEREVDAWGLGFSRGSWYLAGNDLGAGDVRTFRLSRVTTPLQDVGEGDPTPDGFDMRERLKAGPWGLGEPKLTATVAFSPKVAPWAIPEATGGSAGGEGADGWTVAEVPASRDEAFLAWVRSFGPDAELLGPDDLRGRIIESLEEIRASL